MIPVGLSTTTIIGICVYIYILIFNRFTETVQLVESTFSYFVILLIEKLKYVLLLNHSLTGEQHSLII